MVPLDAFCFSNVSFVKIDVEGAERLVFLGAKKTIAHNLPTFIVELTGDPNFTDKVNP